MADFGQEDAALAALQDPTTSPEDLLAITTTQSNLWVLIAQHPNAYPDLLNYLSQYGDDTVRAVVAARAAQAIVPSPEPLEPTLPTLILAPGQPNPAQDAPVPATAPPMPSAPAATPVKKPKKNRTLFIVLATLVFLLCVAVAVYFLVIRPQQINSAEARSDFTAAVSEYQQAQTTLTQKIADAEKVEAIKAQVSDQRVNTGLSSAIDSARSLLASPPDMSEDPKQIVSQTEQIARQTQACDDAVIALGQAMDAVTQSRIAYATDTLNDSITSAQAVLDQSQGLVSDESRRSALASAIQQAHSVVDGFRTGDPSTFADAVATQQANLQQTSQAVLDVQIIKCGNGVVVPTGINPMVCQSMPTTAIQTMTTGGYKRYTQFTMPSGNVGCTKDPYGAGMICEIIRKDWTLPDPVISQCAANSPTCGSPEAAIRGGVVTSIRHTDVAPWANNMANSSVTVPVLAYGQVANFSPVACLSDEDGVVCWDTTTHHGFRMSVIDFTYW